MFVFRLISMFFGTAAPTVVSSEADVANPRTLVEHDESTSQAAGTQVQISHAGGGGWTVLDPRMPSSSAVHTEPNATRNANLSESRDRDHSPPRRRERVESRDASPVRRRQRHDSPDASPPRQSKAASADLSPSRRRRHDSPDASPPRQSKASVSVRSDTSPPRHRRRESPDASPIRRNVRDTSVAGIRDSSPPRLRPGVASGSGSSAGRETESSMSRPVSAASTSRRSRWDATADSEEPRAVAVPVPVADAPVSAVRSTGLRDPKQFLAETRAKADHHRQRLATMDDAESGRGAATVVRDAQGL